MKANIALFIDDFKKSSVCKYILADSQVDIIMLWITGSTLTGVLDSESDYDICVLCARKPQDLNANSSGMRLYSRPGSYFLKYKPLDRKVQWIYNDITDIVCASNSTPLDNIGWAQFKEISSEFIIYKNPEYTPFIDYLISIKDQIFQLSTYLFIEAMLKQLGSASLVDLLAYKPTKPNKGLYHVVWLADALRERPLDTERLLRIKRNLASSLSRKDLDYISCCIDYLMNYRDKFDKTLLTNCDLENTFKSLNPEVTYEHT